MLVTAEQDAETILMQRVISDCTSRIHDICLTAVWLNHLYGLYVHLANVYVNDGWIDVVE